MRARDEWTGATALAGGGDFFQGLYSGIAIALFGVGACDIDAIDERAEIQICGAMKSLDRFRKFAELEEGFAEILPGQSVLRIGGGQLRISLRGFRPIGAGEEIIRGGLRGRLLAKYGRAECQKSESCGKAERACEIGQGRGSLIHELDRWEK